MSARHLVLARARPHEKPYRNESIRTIIFAIPGIHTGKLICYDNQGRFYREESDFAALQEKLSELPLYDVGSHGQLQFRPKNGGAR